MLKIEYSNNSNNIGNLIFQDGWQGRIYLDTDIDLIDHEYEIEVKVDANLLEIPISKTLKQYYSLSIGVKNNLLEAIALIPLCDKVTITALSGQTYIAKDLSLTDSKLVGSYYQGTLRFYTEVNVSRGQNKL